MGQKPLWGRVDGLREVQEVAGRAVGVHEADRGTSIGEVEALRTEAVRACHCDSVSSLASTCAVESAFFDELLRCCVQLLLEFLNLLRTPFILLPVVLYKRVQSLVLIVV